jgi:Cu/Ag efflux protein CusF
VSRASLYPGLAIALLGSAPAFAQQQPAQEAQTRGVVAGESVTAVAIVEAINHETREVTLRKENGEVVSLVIGPEARNLAQVEPGDRVSAAYEVGLVIELGPPGGAPQRVENLEVARAPAGARPGGVVRNTIAVTATVVEIDLEARIVTLRGPRQTVALPVAADLDLSSVKVGDQVGAVYQESLLLRVDPAQ